MNTTTQPHSMQLEPNPPKLPAPWRLVAQRPLWHGLAVASLLGLIALCVAWELALAPIRPGGSALVFKVLPLLFIVPGILKQRLKVMQASTLLLWLYVAEGATRAASDPSAASRALALLEVALCVSLFVGLCGYLKSFKQKPFQGFDFSILHNAAPNAIQYAQLEPLPYSTDAQTITTACTDWRKRYRTQALAVAQPNCIEHIQALVQWCTHYNVALCTQGGNTGLVGGAVPVALGPYAQKPHVLLQTAKMRDVLHVCPRTQSMQVACGFTLQEVQAAAAAHGLYFPLSLASEGSCTIGGTLATNAGGTAVLRYGNMRELCLALQFVDARGNVCGSLNPLHKNNAGFDLRNLLIGSEGTLGIITHACLKLFLIPQSRCTLWCPTPSIHDALALLHHMQSAGLPLSSFEWMNAHALQLVSQHLNISLPGAFENSATLNSAVLVECESACSQTELDAMLERWQTDWVAQHNQPENVYVAKNESEAKAWWRMREAIPEAQSRLGLNIKHDVACPVSQLGAFYDAALQKLNTLNIQFTPIIFGHLGDGNLHFNIQAPQGVDANTFLTEHETTIQHTVHACILQHLGTISAEHGIGQLKQTLLQQTANPANYAHWLGIKKALDPMNILNPGKVVG